MRLNTTDLITVNDVVTFLGNNTDILNLGHYRNAPSVIRLVLEHNLTTIVELHSQHARISKMLSCVFDDVNCTSICDHFDFDHTVSEYDNLSYIEGFSDGYTDAFNDKSVDMVYMHNHNIPHEEVEKTLTEWQPKVKESGIICGNHCGFSNNNIAQKAYGLYSFATSHDLNLESYDGNTFYCVNTPAVEEQTLRPIRMIEGD